ncbi:MAG TPA: sulfotransferase [Steroidobacteraceae bacterium]|jgi:tetratricopeptide (TPR) repeat protein|nr:sulfotransferase [Steroidobacteraceae bacterium]
MSRATQAQDVTALLNDAAARYAQGRLDDAADLYRQAAAIDPKDLRPVYSLALIDIRRGRLEIARQQLRTVAAQDPNLYPAQQNLGAVCQNLNLWQEAADAYRRALRLNPTAVETHFSLARALAVLGHVGESSACYRALAANPAVRLRALTRLAVLDPAAINEQDLAALQRAANDPATLPATRIEAYFAVGVGLEQRSADQAAFVAFKAGNRLKHDALMASPVLKARPDALERAHEFAARFVMDRFDQAFLERQSHRGNAAAPIFVIGMPRCGSSLIEQILSSHRGVQGMGENTALSTVIDRGFTESEHSVNWSELAEAYLALMRQRGWNGADRFVDKTLENHLRVGMIHLMFPKAVILDSTRDPVDTCLSCYRQLFTEGNETLYDLGQIGRAYVRYRRVMEHWDRVLPGRVIRVAHEKLVADTEAQIRGLVEDACKLDWDPACLRFHEAEGSVRTASAAQVRLPVFSTSIGRWKRVAGELEPLLRALGPYAPQR